MPPNVDPECPFCDIVEGNAEAYILFENDKAMAFLWTLPLSKGHTLIIPKYHAAKLHEVPDDYLTETILLAKKVALAVGGEHYNTIQNNGAMANQHIFHAHFHIIPKPNEEEGLLTEWKNKTPTHTELAQLVKEIQHRAL